MFGIVAGHDYFFDEFLWVEKVFGLVVLAGPAGAFGEFDAEEVAAVLMTAMANGAQEVRHHRHSDGKWRTSGNGLFDLQADAGERDVFEVCDTPALTPGFILPNELHEFGAEHPVAGAPVGGGFHTRFIGGKEGSG